MSGKIADVTKDTRDTIVLTLLVSTLNNEGRSFQTTAFAQFRAGHLSKGLTPGNTSLHTR